MDMEFEYRMMENGAGNSTGKMARNGVLDDNTIMKMTRCAQQKVSIEMASGLDTGITIGRTKITILEHII